MSQLIFVLTFTSSPKRLDESLDYFNWIAKIKGLRKTRVWIIELTSIWSRLKPSIKNNLPQINRVIELHYIIPLSRFKMVYLINSWLTKYQLKFILGLTQKRSDLIGILVPYEKLKYISVPENAEIHLDCTNYQELVATQNIKLIEEIRVMAIKANRIIVSSDAVAEEFRIFNSVITVVNSLAHEPTINHGWYLHLPI